MAANEELRDAGCVGRLEEMLALSSVGGQVDVKRPLLRLGKCLRSAIDRTYLKFGFLKLRPTARQKGDMQDQVGLAV